MFGRPRQVEITLRIVHVNEKPEMDPSVSSDLTVLADWVDVTAEALGFDMKEMSAKLRKIAQEGT